MINCEKCGNEVLRSYGDEKKLKLRTNIIIWELDNHRCIAKCLKCKSEVEMPLSLHLSDGRVISYKNKRKEK